LGVWLLAFLILISLTSIAIASAQEKPDGTMTWALHFSLAPTYFDPAETTGIATPFKFLYALHDALLKPMPQDLLTPSLAESWTESPDGLVYEFKLRHGLQFHNGDLFTAEDVTTVFPFCITEDRLDLWQPLYDMPVPTGVACTTQQDCTDALGDSHDIYTCSLDI
jgi:ABC-type transport system substrate-binding protein